MPQFTDDQQRFYLYLLIVGTVGVLFSIVIVATRLVVQKRRMRSDSHSNSSTKGGGTGGLADETTIPSGFNDTISEIDADIDLTTSIPVPSVSKNEVSVRLFLHPPQQIIPIISISISTSAATAELHNLCTCWKSLCQPGFQSIGHRRSIGNNSWLNSQLASGGSSTIAGSDRHLAQLLRGHQQRRHC